MQLTVDVLKFPELVESAQQHAIDNHRHMLVEDNDWWDSEYDYWNEELEEMGFDNPRIWFSGFSSQGDGACFDCSAIDIKKFMQGHKEFFIPLFFPDLPAYVDAIVSNVTFRIEGKDTHYSHKYTRQVEWDYWSSENSVHEELGPQLAEDFAHKMDELRQYIEDVRLEICDKIYKSLESEYDSLMSDECVGETLEINDYLFDKDGDRIPKKWRDHGSSC